MKRPQADSPDADVSADTWPRAGRVKAANPKGSAKPCLYPVEHGETMFKVRFGRSRRADLGVFTRSRFPTPGKVGGPGTTAIAVLASGR